jgi:hypothetical protein
MPSVQVGASRSQASGRPQPRPRKIPPPKKRPTPNPSPAPGQSNRSRGGSSRGGRGQVGAVRMQPPRGPLPPDPGRLPGPLQLMGPGDPMQRLALMMAVMMLGMPLVNGYHTDVGPGEQGARGQTESMLHSPAWIESSREVLVAGKGANPAVPHRNPPVEPGGSSARWILQQVQLGMEGLSETKAEIQRVGQERGETSGRKEWNPGSGGKWPGGQTQERGRSKGDGRAEEGSICDPRQRPKKGPDVQENGRPQLVKNKQWEEHGTARLLLQCSGGVCREGYFLLPYNE